MNNFLENKMPITENKLKVSSTDGYNGAMFNSFENTNLLTIINKQITFLLDADADDEVPTHRRTYRQSKHQPIPRTRNHCE